MAITCHHLRYKLHTTDNAVSRTITGDTLPKLPDTGMDIVQLITGVPFTEFTCTTPNARQWYQVYSFHKLLELKFKQDAAAETLTLTEITVNGRGCEIVPYRPEQITANAEQYGFRLVECHYNLDISPDVVNYSTVLQHLSPDKRGFTANATVAPYQPKDEHYTSDVIPTAKSGYSKAPKSAGYRAGDKGANGYSVAFYASAEVHTDLPAGTWRMEVQAAGTAARQLMLEADKSAATLALISKRITFRSLDQTNKNRAERRITRWWSKIMQGAGSFRIIKNNYTPDIERKKQRFMLEMKKRQLILGDSLFWEWFNLFKSENDFTGFEGGHP